MSKFSNLVMLPDTRANQPAASSVPKGTLYCVTDEGNILERSNGTTWDPYSPVKSGIVLLEQHAASNSASLIFNDFVSADYDEYEFRFLGIRPATDGADLLARFSTDGGSTFDSGTNYDDAFQYVATNNTHNEIGNTGRTFFDIGGDADNASTGGIYGAVTLFDPSNTGVHKVMHGRVSYRHDAVGQIYIARSVVWRNTAAINAVKFFYDSGNITTGTIRCYGYTK